MVDLDSLPAGFLEWNRENDVLPGWLDRLPALVGDLCTRWSLTLGAPYPGIRINYVAPVTRAGGTRCVLKVSRYLDETRNEIAAVHLWAGDGCARLLAVDEERGALLLERLEPGTMLTSLVGGDDAGSVVDARDADDDAATRITAGVLRRLWRPAPPDGGGLRPLQSWCGAFERNRAALRRGDRGFPASLFARADALRQELLSSTTEQSVLHGDMHHFNVLWCAGRGSPAGQEAAPPSMEVPGAAGEWLAIDPKGLRGDRHFDVCQFLHNPHTVTTAAKRRRLDVFCEELGLDRQRARDWAFVHATLNACWAYEDGDPLAEALARVEEALTL